jgi:hypothetical protein
MPVFVANGDSDPMILPHYSYLLVGLIPHAQVKIYPDDGTKAPVRVQTPENPQRSAPRVRRA